MSLMNPRYISIKSVFSKEWCNKYIERFNAPEMQIGSDRYGRYDFIDRQLSKEIQYSISPFMDIAGLKVSHRYYMNKYWPDSSYIGKHVDGHITNSQGYKSLRSIIIYLNTCEGGETIVHMGKDNIVKISPKVGSVLILDQETLHEAGPPTNGFKYILRTDLLADESTIY